MIAHEMKRGTRAFVYIDIKPGKEKEILEKLLKHDEVIEAHIITGQEMYDVLILLRIERDGFLGSSRKLLCGHVAKDVKAPRCGDSPHPAAHVLLTEDVQRRVLKRVVAARARDQGEQEGLLGCRHRLVHLAHIIPRMRRCGQ